MSDTSGAVEKPGTRSISVALEHIEQAVVDLLGETSLLPGQRLSAMTNVAIATAPAGCDLKIVFTGDFVESVKARLDPNSEEAKSYGVERGASQAIARTLRRGSNGFDILFSAGVLFPAEGQLQEERNLWDQVLTHTAAHEAGHVSLGLNANASEAFQDLVKLDETARRFRAAAAVLVEEYRCERLANSQALVVPTHESSFDEDISALRLSLNQARPLVGPDVLQALQITMTAAHHYWLTLAYLVAELLPDGQDSAATPSPLPLGWNAYAADAWPAISRSLAQLEPANVAMPIQTLTRVTEELSVQSLNWLASIGIDYSFNSTEGESCFWRRQAY